MTSCDDRQLDKAARWGQGSNTVYGDEVIFSPCSCSLIRSVIGAWNSHIVGTCRGRYYSKGAVSF